MVPRGKGETLEDALQKFDDKINKVVGDLIDPYVKNENITSKKYVELLGLLDSDKCSDIAITMSSNLNKNYTQLELQEYGQKIFVGKQKNNDNDTISAKDKEVPKKELCNSIALHYIKIFNLIAAILTAVNPNNNLCIKRLNDLFLLVDKDNKIGLSKICNPDVSENSILNEPGVKELLTLYYFYYIHKMKSNVDKRNLNLQYKKLLSDLEKLTIDPDQIEKNNNENNNNSSNNSNKDSVTIKNLKKNLNNLKNKVSKLSSGSDKLDSLNSQIAILSNSIKKYQTNQFKNKPEEEPEEEPEESEPASNLVDENEPENEPTENESENILEEESKPEINENNKNNKNNENDNDKEIHEKYGYIPQTGGANNNINNVNMNNVKMNNVNKNNVKMNNVKMNNVNKNNVNINNVNMNNVNKNNDNMNNVKMNNVNKNNVNMNNVNKNNVNKNNVNMNNDNMNNVNKNNVNKNNVNKNNVNKNNVNKNNNNNMTKNELRGLGLTEDNNLHENEKNVEIKDEEEDPVENEPPIEEEVPNDEIEEQLQNNLNRNKEQFGNLDVDDSIVKKFLNFLDKYQPVKEINPAIITIINKRFKTSDNNVMSNSEFKEFCKTYDKDNNGISIDVTNSKFEKFLNIFKTMKAFYIDSCYTLLDILENDILELKVTKSNNNTTTEEYILQDITYEQLVDLESKTRLNIGELYVKCHSYYLNGVNELYLALFEDKTE